MACFPGLGVARLQSESRYKSRRWRGVKKGEEARGTKQPRKEKVRCQRERGVKAAEKTDKCSKSCLTLHDVFFPQHSSLSLFLQLCRFTSLSLPPICACPAHASLPFLHFYQSCLHVLSPAHTHTLHHFPRWNISTCMPSFVLTLPFSWKHTEHHSALYPNSIHS